MQTQLVAGETLNYVASVADYPASAGWTLTLYLNPRAGGTNRSVVATAQGDDHLLQATSTSTSAWAAGVYGWEIWAELGGERYRIEAGQLDVLPSLISAVAGTDTRSAAEIALDAVRQTIRGTATAGVLSYAINGRELRRYSMAELISLESKLASDVRRDQDAARRAAGLQTSRKVYVRMSRA
jgi:hypothetical protein